jgi:hypothetical protein
MTLFVDMRLGRAQLAPSMQKYCDRKLDELDESNWIAASEGSDRGLRVLIVERDDSSPLAEVFIEPPARAAGEQVEASSDSER